MGLTEIVILVIGGLFFVISFFLPDGKKNTEKIDEKLIKEMVDKEIKDAKSKIDDMVEETVTYSVEKTERALEKLSNEKIMAVDEYSQTVLKKINDNHQEAVFLYDMLNDKDEKIKNAGEELKNAVKSAEDTVSAVAEIKAVEAAATETVKEEKPSEPEFVPFVPKRYELKEGQAVPAGQESELVGNRSDAFKEILPGSVESAALKASENPNESQDAPSKAVKTSGKGKAKASESKGKKQGAEAKTAKSDEDLEIRSEYDGRKNSNEIIKRMHEEGKTNMEIAKELGLGVGEVKLVIDLFASKKDKA